VAALVSDVHERLLADPPTRVADIGCSAGWSSISIARAYPNVRVDGYASDELSIELARSNAEEAGVADRGSFHLRDASEPALEGQYDLATAFECVHDLGRPVEALGTMRRLVDEGGAVIVTDERVEDSFKAPSDDTERLMYGWSVLFCLLTGLADEPSVGTGTVMRLTILRHYAAEAGYQDVEVLPIENDLWRFYRLIP
jgi:ubiquinone/menaquinone biosynthesis C-methylase UbiE